ncbi:hypothetical protein DPMN_110315 [Dreissena polymorpha]|uniref:Uncharacterized protein n=1 Tax=Dreissena polymorpha TaxID=45954 RepID=A0A9D4QN02_DREPO|nr:hypothetical protein DPMN_110315 [Dreissena polymorpha]
MLILPSQKNPRPQWGFNPGDSGSKSGRHYRVAIKATSYSKAVLVLIIPNTPSNCEILPRISYCKDIGDV